MTTDQKALVVVGRRASSIYERLANRTCCLVIVDIMNDFIKPGGAFPRLGYYPLSEEEVRILIANNIRLLSAFRSAGRPVVHIRGEYRSDGMDAAWAWVNKSWNVPGMVRPIPPKISFKLMGSWGAQIIDELKPHDGEIVIVKKGHSGFGFTELDSMLRRLHVEVCVVSGGASEGCLSDTVREGAGYGYEFVIVSDATYRADHPVLATLDGYCASLAKTKEVMDIVDAGSSG